ncbi:CENP-A-nucleosome distal centromere subunit CENP-Q [Penicillium alfredii]|uniref:CENP-A-nucleosome distal centromere subunit CENP-Q n=1 Tax=Penicillium alfredii TaxID=1506179 RepID=A0A9W9EHP6_9EURO|nr:CENP-A-nucleosome distal centromere subunit CENP-Q [Penicillium alfredii]KAJ5081880.1 CENP-A-nucleosome distal centromere subunit CENP-Q [Penicillium alfredii]
MPKRKRTGDSENRGQDDATKRFAYLKPHVRRVPEKTIKSKWTTLPEPVQDKVRDMFHSLERPVIVRQQNERKRIEAQGAVQAVVRNLGRRLPRMPFPPITKDSNFDYESALDEHRSLEGNLATMKDSIGLLRAEIAKEEALLSSETKSLQEMDKNAKRAEAERKRQAKHEHPVLRQLDALPQISDAMSSEFRLLDSKNNQATLDELDTDPEIQGLMKQLHGHLQSMQSNTAPLAGLSDAITRSQAALDLYSIPDD